MLLSAGAGRHDAARPSSDVVPRGSPAAPGRRSCVRRHHEAAAT